MQFSDKMYLLGNRLSIADIYLFVQARWTKAIGLDLSRWGNIFYLYNHIKEQPFTQAALIAERIE
jgi:glutathione S-transferase